MKKQLSSLCLFIFAFPALSMETTVSNNPIATQQFITLKIKKGHSIKGKITVKRDILQYIPLIDRELRQSREPHNITLTDISFKSLKLIIQAIRAIDIAVYTSKKTMTYNLEDVSSSTINSIVTNLLKGKDKKRLHLVKITANILGLTRLDSLLENLEFNA